MPSGVVPLPQYLQTNPNTGIENYLRAQQIVQQRQAQLAQEQHQKDQIALQAQAQAQQSAIHQQELGLRQQAQKAAVDTAAQRLQQQQGHEEARQREAAAEQAYRNAPPQVQDIPGVGQAVYKGGTVLLQKPGKFAGMVDQATPIRDETGKVIGHNVVEDENRQVFRPLQAPKTSAENKDIGKDLRYERSRIDKALDKNASSIVKLPEAEELKLQRDKIRVNKQLGDLGKPPAKEVLTPSPASDQFKGAPKPQSGVRLKRKSDGKILRYFGDPADVKTDEFDVVE